MGQILLGLAAGASLATAWLLPGSVYGAVFTWLTTFLIVVTVNYADLPYSGRAERRRCYIAMYLAGIVSHAIAFHWLLRTIADFGGFPPVAATGVFLLFVTVSALQFPCVVLLYRNLPRALDSIGLRCTLSWIACETLIFRIFPWQLGHTQLGLRPFVQIADVGGVTIVSLLTMWIVESIVGRINGRISPLRSLLPFGLTSVVLIYGFYSMWLLPLVYGMRIDVALIQGNVSIEEKHNVKFFTVNRRRYLELTEQVTTPGMLIVWPESVITDFVPDTLRDALLDPRLPLFPQTSIILGALTAESRDRYFNSALAIDMNFRMRDPYHKQILMPFGEYTPFGDLFPWIKELNKTAANFTPGEDVTIFDFPHFYDDFRYSVSPLICYEDIVPTLSRRAARQGAEMLVNLTNDAWFGDTVAPFQHHLIAAFRAIENRRFLLRATNSGLTAIVDPFGRTVAQLPLFTEGSLLEKVNLIRYTTLYTEYVGEFVWFVGSVLIVIAAVFDLARRVITGRSTRKEHRA